jgi:hypothetical protein
MDDGSEETGSGKGASVSDNANAGGRKRSASAERPGFNGARKMKTRASGATKAYATRFHTTVEDVDEETYASNAFSGLYG